MAKEIHLVMPFSRAHLKELYTFRFEPELFALWNYFEPKRWQWSDKNE